MPGPKLSTEILERRGSWVAKSRKNSKRPEPLRATKVKARPIRDLEDICRTGIPGYDPWDQSAGYVFDEPAAKRAIRFFETRLSHVKGAKARTPFLLERWQRAIIGNLFGWKSSETGLRRYREVFLYVPRKNGKTPMAAGVLVYMLFEDGEPGAEIYGAASEYKQASLVFEHARGMILQDPGNGTEERMVDLCTVFNGQAKAIQLHSDYSTYRVISSIDSSAHGFNTHAGVIDELHTQGARELVDALETSTIARSQPLIMHLTTADFDRPSICNEKHDYACMVRDNGGDRSKPGYDPSFLPIMYEASVDDDWRDEDVWRKANPNLGVSFPLDRFRREFQKALDMPTFENTFKRLHLNVRTKSDEKFIDLDAWDKCGVALQPIEGRDCYAGLDLSSRSDISSLCLVFLDDAGDYDVYWEHWVPVDNAHKRERKDKVPYITWGREDWLMLTEGDRIDQSAIRRRINELGEVCNIRELCIDRWDASKITTELQEDGFTVIEFGQGYKSMSSPTKELETLIMGAHLRHGNNPIARWMAGNCSIEKDSAGNVKPSKKRSIEKIDGIVALIMALGRAMVAVPEPKSIYDTEFYESWC